MKIEIWSGRQLKLTPLLTERLTQSDLPKWEIWGKIFGGNCGMVAYKSKKFKNG